MGNTEPTLVSEEGVTTIPKGSREQCSRSTTTFMKNSNEILWSYLAGLFDGEGTVCISTSHNRNNTTIFQMNVKVANTKLELMQWLITNFGGSYSVSQDKCEGNNRATQYAWMPKGKKNRIEVLEKMLPYLVIKKQQALIGLDFEKVYEGRNGCQPGLKLTTDNPIYIEAHAKRLELRDQLVKLNRKGKI